MRSDNSAERNKGCVHPPKENICAIRTRSPSALGGTVGTRVKTEAMVSSAHHMAWVAWCPLTRLPASPELLAVTSQCQARQHPRVS